MRQFRTRTLALLGMILGLCAAFGERALAQSPPGSDPTAVRPGEHVTQIVARKMELSIVELESRVVELANKIAYVHDFNPETLYVEALSTNRLRLRGEAPGITTVRITDEFDNVHFLEVFVERDVRELQANIIRLFPGSAIRVLGVRDSIVLQGWVTEPAQIPNIVTLARTYSEDVQNHIQVGGGNLVQLRVQVMEVQRSKLEQFGFNFVALGERYFVSQTVGGLVPLAGLTVPSFTTPPNGTISQTALANTQGAFAILSGNNAFLGFLEAIKQESLLKIQAEPTVVTVSGRPATIHSGGEFPILVPQGIGTATIQYREFGVQMEVLPIVLGNGRLQMDVYAQVSERDFANSVDVGGLRVPGITSRDVNTQAEMNFGETLMIGGLISNRLTVSTNKIPFLGDIPYLGAAFSRRNYQVAETELVILVTPHLVTPMNACQVPSNLPGMNSDGPTTHELFFDQHVEVPYFGPDCPTCPPMSSGAFQPFDGGLPSYSSPTPIFPESAPPSMPALSPEPLFNEPAGPGLGPTPELPSANATGGGSVQGAAYTAPSSPGRVSTLGYSFPNLSRGAASPARPVNSGAPQVNNRPLQTGSVQARPAGTPGLITPAPDYTRPTPRFVGSSPAP